LAACRVRGRRCMQSCPSVIRPRALAFFILAGRFANRATSGTYLIDPLCSVSLRGLVRLLSGHDIRLSGGVTKLPAERVGDIAQPGVSCQFVAAAILPFKPRGSQGIGNGSEKRSISRHEVLRLGGRGQSATTREEVRSCGYRLIRCREFFLYLISSFERARLFSRADARDEGRHPGSERGTGGIAERYGENYGRLSRFLSVGGARVGADPRSDRVTRGKHWTAELQAPNRTGQRSISSSARPADT